MTVQHDIEVVVAVSHRTPRRCRTSPSSVCRMHRTGPDEASGTSSDELLTMSLDVAAATGARLRRRSPSHQAARMGCEGCWRVVEGVRSRSFSCCVPVRSRLSNESVVPCRGCGSACRRSFGLGCWWGAFVSVRGVVWPPHVCTSPDLSVGRCGVALGGWVGCGGGCGRSVGVWGRGVAAGSCGCGLVRWGVCCGVGFSARGVCSDEQGEVVDPVERGDEVRGPGPVVGEFGGSLSAGVGESGCGVQQAVAQPFGFGFGQVAVEG